jgi:hypothetical protein
MIRESRRTGQDMAGTTPEVPPTDASPPPASGDDLIFPAAADGAWQRGSSGPRHRGVVVLAAGATLLLVSLAVVLGIRVLSAATAPAQVAEPGRTATIGALAVGTCYHLRDADRTVDSVGEVDVVTCTSPHDGQVYAKVPLDFADFPGDAQLSSAADSACGEQDAPALDAGVRAVDTISTAWYAPLEADWPDSEHVAACVVESDDPDGLTRSWTAGAAA